MDYVLSGFLDEYSDDFEMQLKAAVDFGMNYIELRFADGINVADFDEIQSKRVKDMLSQYRIGVSAIGSPLGKISLEDDFDKHLSKAEKVFRFANTIGGKNIRVFSFYLNGKTAKDCRDQVVERMARLLELAETYDVKLCLENEEGLYGESPENCLDLLQEFKGKMGMAFDMGNFRLCGYEPYSDAFGILKDYIEYFHIKDALSSGEIVPCGEGEARVKDILKKFLESKTERKVFVSAEPHLVDFAGLQMLATHQLKQKRCFANAQQAFAYAMSNLKNMVGEF